MTSLLNNKVIFLTGGTGSFGNGFLDYIIKNKIKPKKLIIFSRDELKQYEMKEKYPENKFNFLRYFIGDIRDKNRLKLGLHDTDIVIHAAALKQVPTAEYNPFEYIKTNVLGAQNIIECCLENKKINKVLALSTDKASSPLNLYGATKLCSDKLFIAANNLVGKRDLKFSILRYGNVMASRGSIIPFLDKCKKKGHFPLTDKRMTRFNITIAEAVKFSISCIKKMLVGGEIFVPKIPSYKLLDLIKAFDKKMKIKIIGIRPGEKIHEEMININDSANTFDLGDRYIILPQYKISKFKKLYKNKKLINVPEKFSYTSEKNKVFLSITELQQLLKILK